MGSSETKNEERKTNRDLFERLSKGLPQLTLRIPSIFSRMSRRLSERGISVPVADGCNSCDPPFQKLQLCGDDPAKAYGHQPVHAGTVIATGVGMLNWERAEDLIAETAREAGVLIAVFAPLEAAFTDMPINRAFVAALVFIGLLFVAGGIILETKK
jgi:hypothetical protein